MNTTKFEQVIILGDAQYWLVSWLRLAVAILVGLNAIVLLKPFSLS